MKATVATEYGCCGESYLYGLELPDNEDDALELIITARAEMDKDHFRNHPECKSVPEHTGITTPPFRDIEHRNT